MFYGWKLCIITFMGNFLLQGSIIYMMNAFIDPLTLLHGWTRAQISMGMSVAALLGALSIPIWSSLSLRFSLRALMTTGALLGGTSLVMLGLTDKLALFYVFYTLAWMSGQAFGGAIGNILINQWFNKEKGRAFGLCNVGTSFSGAIMPFILLIAITNFDVQTAWVSYGIIVLCVAPLCWFFVYDKPEDIGLHVDNIPDGEYIPSKVVPALSWNDVLKNKDVYILGFTFSLALTVGSSVVSQLQPRMVDIGLDSYTAMAFSCLTALFLAAAKYIWGKACDVYNTVIVTRVLIASMLFSLSLIFIPPSFPVLFLFSFCFGITVGGVWSVMPAAVAFYFGKNNFVFYYRVVSTFILLKALGYSLLGFSQQLTGAYDLAYYFFCIILLICLVLTFFLKTKPPYLEDGSD